MLTFASSPRWHASRALPALLALVLLLTAIPAARSLVPPRIPFIAQPLAPAATAPAMAPVPPAPDFGKLPLSFVPNAGQSEPAVRFQAGGLGGMLFFTAQEVVLSLPAGRDQGQGEEQPIAEPHNPQSNIRNQARWDASENQNSVMRLRFAGANPIPGLSGGERLPGIANYFLGNDPARWRTNVPTYAAIVYTDLYPGIALRYDGFEGTLKGTYLVAAGADPRPIRWRYEGARAVRIDGATGDLQIELPGSGAGGPALTERAPIAWQERAGQRVAVEVRYDLAGDGSVGFALGGYDPAEALIIDPALVYSTYLGGSAGDIGHNIAVDGAGNTYISGDTFSTNFPLQNPAQPLFGGSVGTSDAFVVKLNATGTARLYSTYLGGSSNENGGGIAVDTAGNAYISGSTFSTNFPLQNPAQPLFGGIRDAFVVKLNPNGNGRVYSTYLGGSNEDFGTGIALDGAGNAYITGSTSSANFPLQNPAQPLFGGGQDAFVVKLNPNGNGRVYSTYLGGSGSEWGQDIAVDGAGNAYITGGTSSANFPLQSPALQPLFGGVRDAFVVKLNPNGNGRVYSTYQGGSGDDAGWEIALDGLNNAYITGETASTNFPLQNPLDSTLGGSKDAFVTKLNPAGNGRVYSTFLGGSAAEVGHGIAVDGQNNAYITGETDSTNFPVTSPLQPTSGGLKDAFVVKLNDSGGARLFSSYLGGSSGDFGASIAVDTTGNVYITGSTDSTNFPTRSPLQPPSGTSTDAFVTKICLASDCITGLAATNNGPTRLGDPTTLNATITGGSNVTYRWDFGDGMSGSGQRVAHTYAAPGQYRAIVTATNASGPVAAVTSVQVFVPTLLDLAYSVSPPAVPAGTTTTLNYTLIISATGAAATAVLSTTLPSGLTFVPGSLSGGATFANGRISFTGSVTPGTPRRITYQATVNPTIPAGTLIHSTAGLTGAGYLLQRSATVAIQEPTFTGTLVLIYASGDNNLAEPMLRLINDAERAADNPAIKILVALDGPGRDNSFHYKLQPDRSLGGAGDPLCPSYSNHQCGRYVEGQTVLAWNESMGDPSTLADFLTSAIREYSQASQVVLALVGHGGGWSPDATDGQPSWYDAQPVNDGLGGLLGDSYPGTALSTAELGWALEQARRERGRPLDLLYLDACTMAMAEVAYEVSGSVQYLLASENTKWAIFPYAAHLNAIHSGMDGRAIGAAWLANESAALDQASDPLPYTYSLTDLRQMSPVVSAIDSLAQALNNTLVDGSGRGPIQAAFDQSECFDSNQDNLIAAGDTSNPTGTRPDNACDLASFARALVAKQINSAVTNAAQQVQTSIRAAVVAEAHRNGTPWMPPRQEWNWNELGGLSIYVPLKQDEWRRNLYDRLRFGRDSRWDAFLAAWWNNATPPPPIPPCPTCPLPDGPRPIAPPGPPAIKLRAIAAAGGIRLTWNARSDAARYQVLRGVIGSAPWPIATVSSLSLYDQDSTLRRETTYCYQVEALDASGQVVGTSGTPCVRLSYVELWVGEQIAVVGQQAVVGINIRNALGLAIAEGQIVLRFDPNVLTPTGNWTSLLPPDRTQVTYRQEAADRIVLTIQATAAQALAGDMTLLGVEFAVWGQADTRSALELDGTTLRTVNEPWAPQTLRLSPGSITVVVN